MRLYIKRWYFDNVQRTRIIELPEERIFCDSIIESGALVYVVRGGYVQQTISKTEITKIEK